ncbi:MAG: carboxylating nicotinate-nucleotide diphosphorylase [Anaeroplasmataceae bacterium]
MNNIIDQIIINALNEDMPNGDITTDNIFDDSFISKANLVCKENGILSGIDVFVRTFELVSKNTKITTFFKNGDSIIKSDVIATIEGKTSDILKSERVALNILQRMCGIATITNQYVSEVVGNTKILDTRKTTPNLRVLEKKAVLDGGAVNHRSSLSDMVMLKDNHIKACGSITNAVIKVKSKVESNIKVEVEVETLEEFKEALTTDCDVIMLDNMNNELMYECVKLNNKIKKLEASGNMTLDRIKEVSKLGVDFISVGALTHSVKALDISLKFV